MRIIHTLLKYPPSAGGIESYVRTLADGVVKRGESVTLKTMQLKAKAVPAFIPQFTEGLPSVSPEINRTFNTDGYPLPEGLHEELEGEDMDIVHAHAFWYAPADIAARIAKKRGIPFVFNPYYHQSDNRKTIKWQLYRILHGRATIAAADAVVVISPHERDLLRKDRFHMQRVELIPPGVDAEELAIETPNPFPMWNVRGGPILLFAGRVAQSKGIDLLLRAFARVKRSQKDAELVIIGEDFGYETAGRAISMKEGIERSVHWIGKVSRAELIAAYQYANVFVYPGRHEAFGIVMLEAQAAGTPVVATNGGAIPFVVEDGKTGLLSKEENSEDVAKNILLLLEHPNRAGKMGRAGQARVRKQFSWDRSIEKLHRLYTDLVKNRKK